MRLSVAGLSFMFASAMCTASEPDPVSPPASGPTAVTPTSGRSHILSSEMTAKLNASLPKFIPKKTADAGSAKSETSNVDSDVPHNGIIRLPRYDVQEKRLPYHSERDLLTPKGRLALALKYHPGFEFGPFKALNHRRALEWLAEDLQAERNQEMSDLFGEMNRFEALSPPEKSKAAVEKTK